MRKELTAFYGSLYGSTQEVNSMQSIFNFLFYWKMTFAKLVMYVFASLTVSTWVYASVAPESFARTSASVQAWVVAVVDTTLETVGIKAKNNTTVEANVGTKAESNSNANKNVDGESTWLLNVIFWGDTDAEGNTQAQWNLDTDTTVGADTTINTNVQAWVDTNAVVDEVEVVVDNLLDSAGDVNTSINTVIESESTTSTKTNNAGVDTDTSVQGQIEWIVNTQETINTVKEEKNVVVDIVKDVDPSIEVSNTTSSTTTAQWAVDNDSIEGNIDSVTESDTAVWLGL